MTTLFVEQPLDLPGSAKNLDLRCSNNIPPSSIQRQVIWSPTNLKEWLRQRMSAPQYTAATRTKSPSSTIRAIWTNVLIKAYFLTG